MAANYDLYKQYYFPEDITMTEMFTDITAYSVHTKQLTMVEHTIPWETNIPQQYLNKMNNYFDLDSAARLKGFTAPYVLLKLECVACRQNACMIS